MYVCQGKVNQAFEEDVDAADLEDAVVQEDDMEDKSHITRFQVSKELDLYEQ